MKAGTFLLDEETGAVVLVVRGGKGSLRTKKGKMREVRLRLDRDNLELIDADLFTPVSIKDLGPKQIT